jgi:hypothetical protein
MKAICNSKFFINNDDDDIIIIIIIISCLILIGLSFSCFMKHNRVPSFLHLHRPNASLSFFQEYILCWHQNF